MWFLRSCLGWLNVWKSKFSGYWYHSAVRGLPFQSGEWYGSSAVVGGLSEEVVSWCLIKRLGLAYD